MAADATVKVSADTSKFTTGMKKADKSMEAFTREAKKSDKTVKQYNRTLKKTGKTAGGIGKSVAGLAIAGAALAGFKSFADEMDRIGKLAKRLDTTAETIQRIAYAAKLSGATLEQVANAMTRMVRKASEFENAGMNKAFKDLNINQREFVKMGLEDQLIALAKGFNDAGGGGKALATLFKVLEDDAKQLAPLFKNGEAGIRAMFGAANVASNETVATMEKFNDQMTQLTSVGTTAMSYLIDKWGQLNEIITNTLTGMGTNTNDQLEKQQERLNAIARLRSRGIVQEEGGDRTANGPSVGLAGVSQAPRSRQRKNFDKDVEAELADMAEERAEAEAEALRNKKQEAIATAKAIEDAEEIIRLEKEAEEVAKEKAKAEKVAAEEADRSAQAKKDAIKEEEKNLARLERQTAQGNLSAAESALTDTQSGSGQDYISNALRSIGGGFGNAQISGATRAETAMQKQITLQQQQVEELKKVVSALNDESLTTGVAAAP